MNFKQLSEQYKPREKAIKEGIEKLTNTELIALFLRTGNKKESVMIMSQKFIENIQGIVNLMTITFQDLIKIKGIGESKALILLAAIELVKRIKVSQSSLQNTIIRNPYDVYSLMRYLVEDASNEQFFVLTLDKTNKLISRKQLYQGTSNQIIIDLKDIFKFSLENSAQKIICVHNHPSGNSSPSKDDLLTNREISMVANKLNIHLMDHIILGKNEFYSLNLSKKYIVNKIFNEDDNID